MKTFFISISIIFLLIISLILFSDFLYKKKSLDFGFPKQGEKDNSVEKSNFFEKNETKDGFGLTYGWNDYEGNTFYITFALTKKKLSEAENEFGYNPNELKIYLQESSDEMINEMINRIKAFALQQIKKSKYSKYIKIVEIGSDKFNLTLSAPPSIREKVKREFGNLASIIFKKRDLHLKNITNELKKKRKEYFAERGIRLIGDKVEVDYEFCTIRNRPRVRHVFELIKKHSKNLSIYQFLGLMLAFVQEIRYQDIPYKKNSKIILEFWVPPRVLVNNMGDCDSKAITFASLWTHLKNYPLVLIKIKEHLFIGVAIPSMGRATITINGLRYTLCEVAGPSRIPPGLVTRYSQIHLENGQFRYELIKRER